MDFLVLAGAGIVSGLATYFILYFLTPILKRGQRRRPDEDVPGLAEPSWLPRDFVTALVAVLFGTVITLVFLERIDAHALMGMAAVVIPMYIVSRLQGGK